MDDLSFLDIAQPDSADVETAPAQAQEAPDLLGFMAMDDEPPEAPKAAAEVQEEIHQAVDELTAAEKRLATLQSKMGDISVEMNYLWIKNPSNPDEAQAILDSLEAGYAALQTADEKRDYLTEFGPSFDTLRENIREFNAVYASFLEAKQAYAVEKTRVEQLRKAKAAYSADEQAAAVLWAEHLARVGGVAH